VFRVLIVQYQPEQQSSLSERVQREGFVASVYPAVGPKGFRSIRENPPDAILIDLRVMPSYGRAMGALLRDSKSLRQIPMVFLEGDPAKSAKVREVLPDVEIAPWDRLGPAMRRAVARKGGPAAAPVHPDIPLHRKLRIRANSEVALLHEPRGIRAALGELPEGVGFQTEIGDSPVVLAFFKSAGALNKELPRLAAAMRPGRTLWILWPKKASSGRSDLSMPVIREMCQPYRLGEYKVCAFDETWSAMAFGGGRAAARRPSP
jgi:CheY-like chemotaxis protein